MRRKRTWAVALFSLALLAGVIPAAVAGPTSSEVGLVDGSTGIWTLNGSYIADLTGAAEVPGPGDDDASGTAYLNLDADAGYVCFAITHHRVSGTIVAAHIHEGAAGVAGGVVVDLDWAGTSGTGCVTAAGDVIDAIEADPAGYYVNVHSTLYPAGAIRGQLAAGADESFFYGDPGDTPFLGDWDCDGVDTPGLHRATDGKVYLRNSNDQGIADIEFFFGNPDDVPLVGDWDGDGCDTVSLHRPADGMVYIINELGSSGSGLGAADFSFTFGDPGDTVFAGDFDGNGTSDVAAHDPATGAISISLSLEAGPPDVEFFYGNPGDEPLGGDWDGDGDDSIGVYRPSDATFYLRNSNTTGVADSTVVAGDGTGLPVIGRLVPQQPVSLQILAINDFHGNIATSSGSFGGTGRADFLATNIAAAEAEADGYSILVSAGDLIGASPLISGLFHDEPTIEAMNLIGLEINGVGNHEFDEGKDELVRMQIGGSHPVDGDFGGDQFAGAEFEFLSANVLDDSTGDPLFPAYTIRSYGGVPVAFIGMTLEGTPSIVTQAGVAGLTFLDEAETANALVPELQALGVEAIVILLHEGGSSDGGQNDCGTGLTGPIAEITPLFDDAIDLVIAGHTNDEFICEIDGKWVTMADNRGRLFTDIDVTLDPVTRDLTVVAIENKANLQGGVTPDPVLTALIDLYDVLSAPLANAVIGTTTGDILRAQNAAGESALGDVIADAQLAATEGAGVGEADVAFMNPGGIRDDIIFASSGSEADGEFTFGEAFSVQPFGNSLITMTLTGAQIDELLELQFDNPGPGDSRILQVSEGFTYEWSAAAPTGSKVDPASIKIDGVTVDPAGAYRVTVNSFMADGGDNFSVLVDGTDRLGGEIDLDALAAYFGANSPVAPGPQDRIVMIP